MGGGGVVVVEVMHEACALPLTLVMVSSLHGEELKTAPIGAAAVLGSWDKVYQIRNQDKLKI